jgi:hypothetical protein
MMQQAAVASADLLSVAQSVGAVLLFDMYTPAAYTESGGNVTAVVNRITAVSHASTGINPPLFSATGLNGGPCWTSDGTDDKRFAGTEAAVLALSQNASAHEVFAVTQFNVADSIGAIFGASGAATQRSWGGQTGTGAGRWRSEFINDSGTVSTLDTTVTFPSDTNPHLFNFRRGASTSLYVDQVVTSINNTAQDPTAGGTETMTLDTYYWGHTQTSGSLEINGRNSLLVVTPPLDSTQRASLIAAMAAHDPALDGIINP